MTNIAVEHADAHRHVADRREPYVGGRSEENVVVGGFAGDGGGGVADGTSVTAEHVARRGGAPPDRVGVGHDGALAVRDGEVVDERRVLSEQGVGDDAEGVFEENDGSQLGGRRRGQGRSAAEASERVRACWRARVSRGLDGRSFVVRESLGAAAGAHGSDVLAIAGPVDVDEDGVHGEPVEDGGGDGVVAEVATHFLKSILEVTAVESFPCLRSMRLKRV
jgi:hypothetical protein